MAEAQIVQKHMSVEIKAVDQAAGIYDIVISTETPDRDGDIIEVAGWQEENYLKNPVVLFGHDYRSVPVGKTLELRKQQGKYIARFQFREAGGPNDPVLPIRAAWDQGMLNAASVGFKPLEWEPITDNIDPDDHWALMFAPRRYKKQELLEWSIVSIPANQEALRLSYAKMLKEKGGENPYLPADYAKRLKDTEAEQPVQESVPVVEASPIEEEVSPAVEVVEDVPPAPIETSEHPVEAPAVAVDDPNITEIDEQDEDAVLLALNAIVSSIHHLMNKRD
jgi:phage head maturation protease